MRLTFHVHVAYNNKTDILQLSATNGNYSVTDDMLSNLFGLDLRFFLVWCSMVNNENV